MNSKFCILIVIFASVYLSSSLQKQYSLAYKFARNIEGLRYTHGQAYVWAKKIIEQRAIFRAKGLTKQYNEAFNFATEFLKISNDNADKWAKKLILSKGYIALHAKISIELDIFFDRVSFGTEEGKNWAETFLSSYEPLISKLEMDEHYLDIYKFCRTHIFLAYDDKKARNIANKFINNRFRFSKNYNLLEQYVIAFTFAHGNQGLQLEFDKAKKWAENYLILRGVLNPEFSLNDQYQEAFLFARLSRGLKLSDEKSRLWAKNFIKSHAEFSIEQNLLERYQEAFLFAYNGEVLGIFNQVDELPIGIFLRDEAKKYAQELIQDRGIEVNFTKNLFQQYNNAFIFAYSSNGLELEYYKAKNWVKKILEHRIIR